jgi:hypothetical protein
MNTRSKLKKLGKWGLIAFIAYQVIGLAIVIITGPEIWAQSMQIAESIISSR